MYARVPTCCVAFDEVTATADLDRPALNQDLASYNLPLPIQPCLVRACRTTRDKRKRDVFALFLFNDSFHSWFNMTIPISRTLKHHFFIPSVVLELKINQNHSLFAGLDKRIPYFSHINMVVAIPRRRDIMEPFADGAQPVIRTASLASVIMPTVVTVTPAAGAPTTQESSETKDKASTTAEKSLNARLGPDESLSVNSESPSSLFGEPLTKVACHNSEPRPVSHLARICPGQHLEHYLEQLLALGETGSAGESSSSPVSMRSFVLGTGSFSSGMVFSPRTALFILFVPVSEIHSHSLTEPMGDHSSNLLASYETQKKNSRLAETPRPVSYEHTPTCSSKNASSENIRPPKIDKFLNSKKRKLSVLSNHAVGGRLKRSFRKLVSLPSKSWHRRFSITSITCITSTSAGSNEPMIQVETSENSFLESAMESEAPCGEEFYVDTSLDSSASSIPLGRNPYNDSIQSLSQMRPFASSTTTVSNDSDLKGPTLKNQNNLLGDKLAKLAMYGRLIKKTGSINLFVLKEIGNDSGVLLQKLCDPKVMQQMCESGLLKEMVDTELLRQALEFFRLWVDLEALEDAEAEPLSAESPVVESSSILTRNRDIPVLTIEVP